MYGIPSSPAERRAHVQMLIDRRVPFDSSKWYARLTTMDFYHRARVPHMDMLGNTYLDDIFVTEEIEVTPIAFRTELADMNQALLLYARCVVRLMFYIDHENRLYRPQNPKSGRLVELVNDSALLTDDEIHLIQIGTRGGSLREIDNLSPWVFGR